MPDNASATYRGFRNQALYVLFRLLTDEAAATQIYRPEGAEDLAVYQSEGVLVEAIQVKDYSSELALSALKPESPKGFFARFLTRRQQHPRCRTKMASFSSLGPELSGAIAGQGGQRDSVVTKLCNANRSITAQDASTMLEDLRGNVIHPNSHDLLEAVSEKLRGSAVGGSLEMTVDLLMYWVFQASEHARDITKSGLLEHLNRIAVYLAALRDNSIHWGTAIQPIEDKPLDQDDRNRLVRQYRQGVQARWEHILADADCVRLERLQEIHNKIKRRPVVIVRGASGQGKSSLGWRYLRDHCPNGMRFHVRLVESRQHAMQIANALGDHVRKLGLKAIVYVDVDPVDSGWTDLVRELAASGLSVLITIREEDFRRANIALGDFSYGEVVLDGISKSEAEPIFAALAGSNSSRHLDFEETWSQFSSGTQSPLLEFTYLAFQGESLDSRIASQVRRIQTDATTGANGLTRAHVDLLALASIAAETGASLNFELLCSAVGLMPILDPLRPLAEEYLIQKKTEGSSTKVVGLHALRSRAVVKALFSSFPEGWVNYASRVLPLIVDHELGAFLLCAFSRHPESSDQLFRNLCDLPLRSWTQAASVTSALLWEGINRYEVSNREALVQGIQQVDSAWWLLCDSHVGMPRGTGVNTLELVRQTVGRGLAEIALTPKMEVFRLFREWVRVVSSPHNELNSRADWPAAGDVAYWIGLIEADGPLRTGLINLMPETFANAGSIEEIGLFIEGRAQIGGEEFKNWCSEKAAELRSRFVTDTNSIHLDDDGVALKVYFSVSDPKEDNGSSTVGAWNNQAMRRIELLRHLFPYHQTYSSQGLGLEIFEQITGHDPTTKQIPSANLPSERSIRLNAHFIGLVAYRHLRSETWREYIDAVLAFRKEVSACFRKLHRGWGRLLSETSPRQQSFNSLPGAELDRLKVLSKLPMFPRVSVDEWGFLSEQTNSEALEVLTMQKASLRRFDAWKKAFGSYEAGVGQVTMKVLPLTTLFAEEHRGRMETQQESADYRRVLYNLAAAWEALETMQSQFQAHFERFYSVEASTELERNERSNVVHLWPIAFAMVNRRQQRRSGLAQILESDLARRRLSFLQTLRTEVTDTLEGRGTVEIVEEGKSIKGKTHLCIVCNYQSRLGMEECSREIPFGIWRASQSGGWEPLEWKPLEIEWPNIAVVSLIRGKLVSAACARISTSILFGTPSDFQTQSSHYTRVSVPPAELESLGLECWDSPLLRAAQGLIAGAGAFVFTNMRFYQLAQIISQHSLGEDDQARILRPFGKELGTALTAAQSGYAQLVEVLRVSRYSQSEEWTQRLTPICQSLIMELDPDQTLSLNISSFASWIAGATNANNSLVEIYSEMVDFVTGSESET